MKFIMNGINGSYLLDILELASREIKQGRRVTERVDAAVAFATRDEPLFKWCLDNGLPLRFWGRFDESVPISIPVLEGFLSRRSPNYTCKLLRHFHPKVIWMRGFGAYIGSANLTDSAWYNNIEAGVFLDEEEMILAGHDFELEEFFREIDSHATPLTDEIFRHIQARSRILDQYRKQDRDDARNFLSTDYVHNWQGLSRRTAKGAANAAKGAFLKEWYDTLQIIRNIGAKVSIDANRPRWIAEDAPLGAQADQFLHAHYYENTFEGPRANYEKYYEDNKRDPLTAEDNAIAWWHSLASAPTDEERTLNEYAPYLRKMLQPNRLQNLTEDDIFQVLSRIHATTEYARRVSNRVVGLSPGQRYSRSDKLRAIAKQMVQGAQNGRPSATKTWAYVLYGGSLDDTPSRMWDALHDPQYRIDNFGVSSMGELIGWALPDRFPPRNGRTSKALRSLGYNVTVHVGG